MSSCFKQILNKENLIMMVNAFLLILFVAKVGADACGNRCTSSQICGEDDGICYDKSELITCNTFGSIFNYHYCKKDQDCCHDGCMPKGGVCCYNSYCESNHTCCSIVGCCPQGTFCSGFKCVLDRFSTQKPSTATPRPTTSLQTTSKPNTTAKPRTSSKPSPTDFWTTLRPITRYPTRKPDRITMKPYDSDSSSTLETWKIASIVSSVIFLVVVVVAVVCVIRSSQNNRSNAQAPYGRQGMILNAPAQIYGQTNMNNEISNSVPVHTNIPSQQPSVAYITTKPAVQKPVATPTTNVNNGKMQLFSL